MSTKQRALPFLAAIFLAGCGNPEEAKPVKNSGSSGGTTSGDYLGAVNNAQKSAVRTIDLASTKQALALYQAQEDHYPATLEELVKKNFIAAIPVPPKGSRLDYNPQTGEVRFIRE